jgi:hypothetical protein
MDLPEVFDELSAQRACFRPMSPPTDDVSGIRDALEIDRFPRRPYRCGPSSHSQRNEGRTANEKLTEHVVRRGNRREREPC